MNNRKIPPHIAVRMTEIAEVAMADGIVLPLSLFVIAMAEEDGFVVDLVTGEISRDDVCAWPMAEGADYERK